MNRFSSICKASGEASIMAALSQVVRSARYVWSAPCTAVGLFVALLALPFGVRASIVNGVIEFAISPGKGRLRAMLPSLPFRAITLGHVIVGCSHSELCRVRSHEAVHVRQYERWGPLFFLAYPASSLIQLLRGKRPYLDNHFELQARAVAESTEGDAAFRAIAAPPGPERL